MPLLTTTILIIWMSQIVGMLDVGKYLLTVEASIRTGLPGAPPKLMTWEDSVSTQKAVTKEPNYAWHYLAVIGLFGVLTLASIFRGAYAAHGEHNPEALAGGIVVALGFLIVCAGVTKAVVTARDRNRTEAEAL